MFNIGLNEKGKPLPRPRMSVGAFVKVIKNMTERVHKKLHYTATLAPAKVSFLSVKRTDNRGKKSQSVEFVKVQGIF